MPADFEPKEYIYQWLHDVQQSKQCKTVEGSVTQLQAHDEEWADNTTKRSPTENSLKRKHRSPLTQRTTFDQLNKTTGTAYELPSQLLPRGDFESQVDGSTAFHVEENPRYNKSNCGKRYEKRARHKTRAEKYDLRPEKKANAARKAGETARERRRRKRKKSGTAINNEFQASNVEQSRLSLKPNCKHGLFGKGKASSPQQRRGLPDLTFAEMTFLSRPRELNEEKLAKQRDNQNAKRRNHIQANKEVSEYFSKPLGVTTRVTAHSRSASTHGQSLRAVSSPAGLSKITPLNRSQATNRYPQRSVSGDGLCEARIAEPRNKSTAKTLRSPDQTRSGSRNASDIPEQTGATSFVSWSTSPPLQGQNPALGRERADNESVRIPADKHKLQKCPEESIYPESYRRIFCKRKNSSTSNSSLAALARDSLRVNVLEGRELSPSENPGIHNYSLEDLRDLVHLSSLRVPSSRPHLNTADSLKREKNAANILLDGSSQSPVSMDKSNVRDQALRANTLSSAAAPRELLVPTPAYTINDVQNAFEKRPEFLGEFRISPSKANALLNPPRGSPLPRQRIQSQSSHSLNNLPLTPSYDDYYLAHKDNRRVSHSPIEHFYANETVLPGPAFDDPLDVPHTRLPAPHPLSPDDISPQQEYLPLSTLAQDLFPLDETDLLGYRFNFDGNLPNDDSGLHHTCSPLIEDQYLRTTQTCDPVDLDSSIRRQRRTASYVDMPQRTQASDFLPNDVPRTNATPRPTTATGSRSDLRQPQYSSGSGAQSSTRPTLLRAEDLRHGRDPGGDDALEGFWRRPPGMPY